MSSQKLW